jgi:uncharacterized surface protein with fasciclin (FAS1) repeats
MRNINKLTALMLGTLMIATAAPALAGSCGSSASHTHAEEAQAIFPLAKDAGFNTLIAAVQAAGLEGTLTEGGPFTVFAPTDEAFAKLPAGTVEALLEDPEALKQILLYHVVSGDVRAADVVKLRSAATLNGQDVAINIEDGVRINDANVIKTDIGASNGVVHVIDTVLIPQTM